MDNPETDLAASVVKLPRKPRPSELAKKAAKAAGKTKPKAAKKTAKPKAKKTSKPKAVKKAAKKPIKKDRPVRPKVRTARLDIRCLPADRKKVMAKAEAKGMTLTQVVMAGIAKL